MNVYVTFLSKLNNNNNKVIHIVISFEKYILHRFWFI